MFLFVLPQLKTVLINKVLHYRDVLRIIVKVFLEKIRNSLAVQGG